MRLIPLASGSRGNATLVEFGETRLLVDAGVSAKQLTLRIQSVGVDPASIHCMLLSHEHQDHTRGAERFSKLYGVPVACTTKTLVEDDVLAIAAPVLGGKQARHPVDSQPAETRFYRQQRLTAF